MPVNSFFGVPIAFWGVLLILLGGVLGVTLIKDERSGTRSTLLGVLILVVAGGAGSILILGQVGWLRWTGPWLQ